MNPEQEVFEKFLYYERRFRKASMEQTLLRPWILDERENIIALVKKVLGIEEKYIPVIHAGTVRRLHQEGFDIEFLTAESWPGVKATAHLYIPSEVQEPYPFVLLCCGHGAYGKLNPGYQAMARRLARQGAMVLVPDNIGQGERTTMGHRDVVFPFACGLSLQGLIVMETMAWLRWALESGRVDKSRVAAIGNSGGGTLTLFLGALCPELTVLSSSGYPSSFEFIAQKEKKHCHCNILPGIVGKLEMWQILGVFAPKPLFLFQGAEDPLFPEDIFFSTCRKVAAVYEISNAPQNISFLSIPGPHAWFNEKRFHLAAFLADCLGLLPAENLEDDMAGCLSPDSVCLQAWPENSLTADELSMMLTGIKPASDVKLWDVYPPAITESKAGIRGDIRQIFAQYEAFLNKTERLT